MGSAELVLSEMKLRGAPAVSRRLDSDENFGRTVMNGIATGDSVWLDQALDDAKERRLERINPSYLIKNKPVAPPRRVRRSVTKPKQTVTPPDSGSSD